MERMIHARAVYGEHLNSVVDLSYSTITPTGIYMASASLDGQPMVRQGMTGQRVSTFRGHSSGVLSCCFTADAQYVATASADLTARVWNATTGIERISFQHEHIVRACAFNEDRYLLVTGGFEKILRIFDLIRFDAPTKLIGKAPSTIRTVVWANNGWNILGSCADMGGVRVWDVRNGKIVHTLRTQSPVNSVEISQDGETIVTADGSSVKFWSKSQLQILKSFDMPSRVESISLEPIHENQFVAAGEDKRVYLLDSNTGNTITVGTGHNETINCVRFSPDGESYASGSEDGTIRIWSVVD